MPHIQLTLRNDDGTTTEQIFDLGSDLTHLDAIDEAVEQFKNSALPVVEQQLLQKAQERLAAQEKKTLVEGKRQRQRHGADAAWSVYLPTPSVLGCSECASDPVAGGNVLGIAASDCGLGDALSLLRSCPAAWGRVWDAVAFGGQHLAIGSETRVAARHRTGADD